MLNKIKLQNFKCFKELIEIPLAKINLFTGVNGKGKSTVIQSLLLFRQSVEINRSTEYVYFNGNCVELGSFADIKNTDVPTKEPINLSFAFESLEGNFEISYELDSNEIDDMNAVVKSVSIRGIHDSVDFDASIHKKNNKYVVSTNDNNKRMRWSDLLFNRDVAVNSPCLKFVKTEFNLTKIHYVSADRLGPRDYYSKTNLPKFLNVGNRGQHTATILAKKKLDPVVSELAIPGYPKTVLDQTEGWLNAIFGEGRISVMPAESNIVILQMSSSKSKQLFKPMNVGFGYSYVLPIVVSALIAQVGSVLIVENPEAHLHPRAQSNLIKFLAKVASAGIQVIIESHSDHIFNGLRVAVVDPDINIQHSDARVIYFTGTDKLLEEIEISSDGSVTNWPEDFFDQTDKDFRILFGM